MLNAREGDSGKQTVHVISLIRVAFIPPLTDNENENKNGGNVAKLKVLICCMLNLVSLPVSKRVSADSQEMSRGI